MMTPVIFIGMEVQITAYTEKYPDILFILLKYMQLLPKNPQFFWCLHELSAFLFFPCGMKYCQD